MNTEAFIAWHPLYAHPLPEGHRFPMLKYELIPEQLLYEGSISPGDIFYPERAVEADVLLVHNANYWSRMKQLALSEKEMRVIGFPLSEALVERELRITQGTIHCALLALNGGLGINVAGGTHHAFSDRGEGFCLLNDFAIAAAVLKKEKPGCKVLIVDLDVHQGNGSASIFKGDPQVFTFSMHGQHNYPFRKEKSTLDIGLEDGTVGATYLRMLEEKLIPILETFLPDVVFYLSGVDVLATDKFGKLKLSLEDCNARDRIVLQACKDRYLGVALAMGGGYSPQIKDIVNAHCNTFKEATGIYQR